MADETTNPDVEVNAASVSDGAYTLIIADFSDTDMAWEAYEALKSVENGRSVEIEGVIVVRRSAEGKLEIQKATDHSTKSGLKWGVVGGIALGVIFPPSILGSAAVAGGAGAFVGKLRQRHHNHELEQKLENAITPGHSGLLALVSDPGEIKIRKALERAETIVESTLEKVEADDIKAAAKEVQGGHA